MFANDCEERWVGNVYMVLCANERCFKQYRTILGIYMVQGLNERVTFCEFNIPTTN